MTATTPKAATQTEPSAGKKEPEHKTNSSKVKSLSPHLLSEEVLAGIAALGAGIGLCLILAANIKPYSNASNKLILKISEGAITNKIAGLIVGCSFFAAIQSLEVRPHFLEGSLQRQSKARFLSNFAYGLDLALGISFFPPLKVSIQEFAIAPNLTSINIFNLIILIVTLFGCELYVRMLKNLN